MESIPLSRRELLYMSRQLRISTTQAYDMISFKPEGLSGREIYIELIHEVCGGRDSRKFIQAAFPIPELKVEILDFMNKENSKIELTSELLKFEKSLEQYNFNKKARFLSGYLDHQ